MNTLKLKWGLTLPLFLWIITGYAQNKRAYFQQEVNYLIEVTLNDNLHELHAYQKIEYINNSPVKLDSIYFHLWPNGYKTKNTPMGIQLAENGEPDFYYAYESERGNIDSLNFKVNGKKIEWKYANSWGDIAILKLNEPLPPNGKIEITTPFKVKFPGDFSRLGHVGQSYQVTQWYPKPAVYDKDGWHPMPYLDQGEFYSEYGSFEVKITLPKNYVVGATGDLQEQSEIDWLLDKASKTAGRLTYSESETFPKSAQETKTITYKQKNVHDFAWFADKRYHVLKGSVKLPNSERTVDTWIMYTNYDADLWKDAIPYMNQAIYSYSLWNGNYPYKQATAVFGALSAGGGMEYPNVTVIGETNSPEELETVIVHEIGHNWFQGILGFNERDAPALDEGINTFNELRYKEKYMPDKNLTTLSIGDGVAKWLNFDWFTHRDEFYYYYLTQARSNKDQALSLASSEYTSSNYGAVVYAKKGLSVQTLRASLGDSLFDVSMQAFFEEWKFKHPSIADWRQVMEETSKQNLDWFFNQYYQTNSKIDLKAKKIKKKEGKLEITVKNKGDLSTPFSITSYNSNNEELHTQKVEPMNYKKITVTIPKQNAHVVVIDGKKDLMDINRGNNNIKTSGLLKKVEPLQLRFLVSNENPKKSQVLFTPIAGWNTADELMLGVAFYNKSYIEKPFEWYLGPMYSFHREEPTGIADLSYHIYPTGFRRITANMNFMRFAYDIPGTGHISYSRYYPKLQFELKPRSERSGISQQFDVGVLHLEEEYSENNPSFIARNSTFGKFKYEFKKEHFLYELKASADFTAHEDFAQGNYSLQYRAFYNKGEKAFTARLFVGHFFENNSTSPVYNLRMDGQTGYLDYQKEQIFADRAGQQDLWKNQMNENHGAFKTPTSLGQSNKWIGALNLKAEAPFWVPLGVYADFGVAERTDVMYNAGFSFRVIRDICEIYFPVMWSQNIKDVYEVNNTSYGDRVRFTLNLPLANPYLLIQKIQF